MAFIEIRNLFKRFKNVVAVNRIRLDVSEGEMLTLLGPSGCGKTTTLRCVAGLEKPEEGDIVIDGRPMLSQGFVQPSKRGIGMVFQNYAVWPHMKVFSNVAYGLKLKKISRRDIQKRVLEALELENVVRARVGRLGEWLRIRTPEGSEGYVAAWYLRLYEEIGAVGHAERLARELGL